MKRARTLLIFGIWIAVLPYLGFPLFWKDILFTLTGLGLAYLAFISYKEHKKATLGEKAFDNFHENRDFEIEIETEESL